MPIAVVIEKGASLPENWLAEPNVLVVSQLTEETETQFIRRLRRRLARHAPLSGVRYYAAPSADGTCERFRKALLRTIVRKLSSVAQLNLIAPVSGFAQSSFFAIAETIQRLPGKAGLSISLTFMQRSELPGLPAVA